MKIGGSTDGCVAVYCENSPCSSNRYLLINKICTQHIQSGANDRYGERIYTQRHHMPLYKNSDILSTCAEPNMVRLAGFEPATYGLEVRCSIQLSYRRTSPEGA